MIVKAGFIQDGQMMPTLNNPGDIVHPLPRPMPEDQSLPKKDKAEPCNICEVVGRLVPSIQNSIQLVRKSLNVWPHEITNLSLLSLIPCCRKFVLISFFSSYAGTND